MHLCFASLAEPHHFAAEPMLAKTYSCILCGRSLYEKRPTCELLDGCMLQHQMLRAPKADTHTSMQVVYLQQGLRSVYPQLPSDVQLAYVVDGALMSHDGQIKVGFMSSTGIMLIGCCYVRPE